MHIFFWLIIGAIAGWLAGTFMKGGGFGLVADIVLGIVGALVGGFLFGLVGIEGVGWIGSLITATIGAIVILALVKLLKRA